MATVSTAKEVRESNPEVAYEDQVFTEPFDIEVQAIQKATAAKVGWRLADAFLYFALVQKGFGALGKLHFNADVVRDALPVIVRLDTDISGILTLLIAAEGKDIETTWADLNSYLAQFKATNAKYFPKVAAAVVNVEDDIVQTSAASLAPQN